MDNLNVPISIMNGNMNGNMNVRIFFICKLQFLMYYSKALSFLD